MNLDTPSKHRLTELYPDFAQRVVNVYEAMYQQYGLQMRCTTGYRSIEEQEKLYAIGRSQPGSIVTNAKPGLSLHHYGLAADSCFVGNDPYLVNHKEGGAMWINFGNLCRLEDLQWGGDFKNFPDYPHVQQMYGLSLPEIMDLYEDGGNPLIWHHISQGYKEPIIIQ